MTKRVPSVCISLPAYDQMHVATCLSLLKLFDKFTKAKIKTTINTFKCPYIGYSRNVLSALFMETGFDYQLFVDADVEFEPDVVGRMIIAEKDFICCPYRKKTPDNSVQYSVEFADHKNINIDTKGVTELKRGPAGLTMIHRKVYDQLIAKHPDMKIKNYNHISAEAAKYFYNFWETEFKDGIWKGEDVKFCDLAREAGFILHAVVDGETTHYGTYGYKGRLVDTFQKANGKAD